MPIIGVDLGGTNMRAGRVENNEVVAIAVQAVKPCGSREEILEDLCDIIAQVLSADVKGLGVGVPSVVDTENGIAYDVINIPSWQEVALGPILHRRFNLPVFINNDANCFAVGEKYYGKAQGFRDAIGLIIGTGLGAGVIVQDRLYSGTNCGAGEFGMMPYRDGVLEHYCSGQFFQRQHNRSGAKLAQLAAQGDEDSLAIFAEYGLHLAEAVKLILYALDPQIIVLGGSVSKSFPYFQKAMWQGLQSFAYRRSLDRLQIVVSDLPQSAILGAAALYLDAMK
ncbi:ROK family protein [bacterium]|nr:ROK family protein [bacterium]